MTHSLSTTTARAWPEAGRWGGLLRRALLATSLAVGGLFTASAAATVSIPVTSTTVAEAVAGGQLWLFNKFDGTHNYWPSDGSYDNPLSNTSAAVAALIETNKYSDPLYKPKIDAGIAYIKTQVKPNGGIYENGNEPYETGLALVALSLYGNAAASTMNATETAALKTTVRNAVDFLKSFQNIENSQRGGDYTAVGGTTTTNPTACGESYTHYYGGWGYYPGDNASDKCRGGGDLSNTQFAVMGLWYGSHYLGDAIDTAPWAKALLNFVKNLQGTIGGFNVYANTGVQYPQRTGTASALWVLAMIGQQDAKKNPLDANTMVQNGLNWFANGYLPDYSGGDYVNGTTTPAYTWHHTNSYMYFVYGMSKALTGIVGPTNSIGTAGTPTSTNTAVTHSWALDMEDELLNGSFHLTAEQTTASGTGTATASYWSGDGGLDFGTTGKTAWALLSLAFGSVSTESTEKLLAQEEALDNPIKGLLTLRTTGGVTLSAAGRGRVDGARLGAKVVLPVGAVNFTLNNVTVGGTALLTIAPPAAAMVPGGTNSFVASDGTLKPGLNWYKISGGDWKGEGSVPISINTATGVISVILRDGGPEDEDGVANGKIVDPGAPGYDEGVAADSGGWFGCSAGKGQPDPTLLLLLAGGLAFLVRRRRF